MKKHESVAKNIKLTSKAAQKVYLQGKTGTTIRRNMLKQSSKMFLAPTSRIMTVNAVRCGQYRQRQKEKLSDCPITSLTYMKSSNLFTNCIHRIGNDPFFVFYCTPEQTKLFSEFKKKNKIFKVSCDATGGVVHPIGNVFSSFQSREVHITIN